MAFPTIGISASSEEIINTDTTVDRSVSGRPRARSFGDNNFRTFKLVYDVLTDVQKYSFIKDYNANKAVVFTYTYPWGNRTVADANEGKTEAKNYSVMWGGPPVFKALGGTFWSAEVILEQVA